MKIIILFGPPGVGKGTQATLLSNKLNFKTISTGALLRNKMKEDSDLSKVVTGGNYAPDDLVSSLVEKEILSNQTRNGYILDGYPRTLQQSKFLDSIVVKTENSKLFFVCLSLSDSILIERLTSRFVCRNCNVTYNSKTSPPRNNNICDQCKGGNFFARSDDNIESIKVRLSTYKNQTQHVIKHYQNKKSYFHVVANETTHKIHESIYSFVTDGVANCR